MRAATSQDFLSKLALRLGPPLLLRQELIGQVYDNRGLLLLQRLELD